MPKTCKFRLIGSFSIWVFEFDSSFSSVITSVKKSEISFLSQAWGVGTCTAAWSQLNCYKNRCISACVRSILLSLKNILNSNAGNNPFRPSPFFHSRSQHDKGSLFIAEERHAEPWPSHCWVLFVSVTITTAVLWPASSRSMLDGGKELKGCRRTSQTVTEWKWHSLLSQSPRNVFILVCYHVRVI